MPDGMGPDPPESRMRLFTGRTATLYDWGDGRVVKAYHRGVPRAVVEREQRNTEAARALGLAVPATHGILDLDGRFGLVLDRVDGPTMMDQIERGALGVDDAARQLGRMHAALNAQPGPLALPRQRQVLRARIGACQLLAPAQRDALLRALDALPDGDRLCHGDLHPRNVICAPGGDVTIDWIDATCGAPAADAARTSLLFQGHRAAGGFSPEAERAMDRFHAVYLDTWFERMAVDRRTHARWLPVLAAARLAEGIAEQRDWLLAQARAVRG